MCVMSSDIGIYKQTVLEIVHLIQDGFAFLTGGRDFSGSPIIIFPDRNVKAEFTDEEFRQMLAYFTAVPPYASPEDVERGFVIIIDRRNSKWGRVQSLITKIEASFPSKITAIYVLGPSSGFQRLISELKMGLIRSSSNLQVSQLVMINPVSELQNYMERNQLIRELDGTHQYNHDDWIENRVAVENFAVKEDCIAKNVYDLCKEFVAVEMPMAVSEAEAIVGDRTKEQATVMQDINKSVETGLSLLNDIRFNRGKTDTSAAPDKRIHIVCIERALDRLQDCRQKFEAFWFDHDRYLQWNLRFSTFVQSASQTQFKLDDYIHEFDKLRADSSFEGVKHGLAELEKYGSEITSAEAEREGIVAEGQLLLAEVPNATVTETSSLMLPISPAMMEEMKKRGEQIVSLCDSLPKLEDAVRIKLSNLTETLKHLMTVHHLIQTCQNWRNKGVVLLGQHSRENNSVTSQSRRESISQIKAFVINKPDTKGLESLPDDFAEDTKASVLDLRGAVDQMKTDCELLIEKLNAANHAANAAASRGSRASRRESDDAAMKCISASCLSDRDNAVDMINGNSPTNAKIDDSDRRLQTRKHVMSELIETERVYVESLQSIFSVFWKEIDNPANSDFVPKELKEDRRSLFGNWEDLLKFHKSVLLKKLEACVDQPGEMSRCFQECRDAFEKYSDYCMNKYYADALLHRLGGDQHRFIRHCQTLLNHNLPLSAFLLKPVQRVQKYQLLLKEMLKNTPAQTEEASQLELALNVMLRILRTLNDSMVLCDIVDYQRMNKKDMGRLLLHENFQVSADQKETKSGRQKLKERHVILFENKLLVCKTRLAGKNQEKIEYHTVHELSMNEIGMTQSKTASDRRFEVWVNNRRLILTLQAPTAEVKQCWTNQLQDLLFEQLKRLKEKAVLQRGTSYSQSCSAVSSPSPTSKFMKISLPTTPSPSLKGIRSSTSDDDVERESEKSMEIPFTSGPYPVTQV